LNDELPSFVKVNVKLAGDTAGDDVVVPGDTLSRYCFSALKAAPDWNVNARRAAVRNPRIFVRIVFMFV
jgi:hypothetical protein